jgi:RNA polymerase sigma factor (sigma-70 family)
MLDNNYLEATISQTLAKHDWRLTSFPEVDCDQQQFVARVKARLVYWAEEAAEREENVQITRELIERAVKHEYSRILHHACCLRNTAAETRTLEELWHWIYPYIRARINDAQDAEDVAQRALINIWRKCGQVRDPGAFLGYAYMVAIREVQAFYREAGRKPQVVILARDLEGDSPDEDNEYAAGLAAYEQALKADLTRGLIQDETEQEILRWLEKCIPKSAAQRLVIMELVIRERSTIDVANMLNTKVANVYLLKHRALKALRKCVELLRMLCEAMQPSVAREILRYLGSEP